MASASCTSAVSLTSQSSGPMLAPLFGNPNFVRFSCARSCKVGVKCSYADPNIKGSPNVGPIDVVADVKAERIVVLGGSGFAGSAICKAAVSKGIEVISLSRSGRPSYSGSWVDQVNWLKGLKHELFYED